LKTRRRTSLDVALEDWSKIARELYGVTDPKIAGGYLGAVRCTLAARRDLHHGGRSGVVDQRWPAFPFERAPEDACLVHACWRVMPDSLAEIVAANYVPLEPKSRQLRAELLGLSRPDYYARLDKARAHLSGYMQAMRGVRKVSDTLPLKMG
jgi:hypothetical protein